MIKPDSTFKKKLLAGAVSDAFSTKASNTGIFVHRFNESSFRFDIVPAVFLPNTDIWQDRTYTGYDALSQVGEV